MKPHRFILPNHQYYKTLHILFVAFLALLLTLTLARLSLFLVYKSHFDLTFSEVIISFIRGFKFDVSISCLIFAVPTLLLLLPIPQVRKAYWVSFAGFVLYTILFACIFVLIGDLIYFDYVSRHIGRELTLAANEFNFFFKISTGRYLWATCLFFITFIVGWITIIKLISKHTFFHSYSFSYKKSITLFLFVAVFIVVGARGGFSGKPLQVINAYQNSNEKMANLTLNGLFTGYHSSRKSKAINYSFFSGQEKQDIKKLLNTNSQNDNPFARQFKNNIPNKKNVVILVIESLSYQYIDALAGNNMGLTPYLDKLVSESITYENFYAAGQRSYFGMQAILTGVPILKGFPYLGTGLEVYSISRLGSIAKNYNYSTFMMQSSPRYSLRLDAISKSTGFDHYFGKEDYPILLDYPAPETAHFGWDYEMLNFANHQISQAKKPFLLFMFTGTTHEPYPEPPKKLLKFPHGKNRHHDFYNTINYLDWSIKSFIETAKKEPWFDNTVFIITADHTRGGDSKDFRGAFRIPLLIYSPKNYKPEKKSQVASQLNLLSTVIDIMGIPEKFTAVGGSLLRENQSEPFAFVSSGDIVGAISKNMYIKHTLQQRVGASGDDKNKLQELENKLLLTNQFIVEALNKNTWQK